MHHFLEHRIVAFSIQDSDDHQRVTDLSSPHHVVVEFAGKLFSAVGLAINFDKLGLLNVDPQSARCLLELLEDVTCLITSSGVTLVNDDPVASGQVHRVTNRTFTHSPLIAADYLVHQNHLWSRENVGFHGRAFRLNNEAPVLERLLFA